MPLETVSLVQDLQPQYAAFLAISVAARHVIPTTGDHVLTFDVGGGLQAEQIIVEVLDSECVTSGDVACERVGSSLELLAGDINKLKKIVASFTLEAAAEVEILDSIVLEELGFDYANLVNRTRKGALVVAGDSIVVFECCPSNQAGVLANQIEAQHPEADLVNIDTRSGQVTFKGSASLLKLIQASNPVTNSGLSTE